MDTDETISFSKSDPAIAKLFADCKPGDEISITLEYNGQSATVDATVGQDDEQTFTGTINNVTAGEPDADEAAAGGGGEDDAAGGDEDETPAPPAKPAKGAKAMSPMDYIKSKRK